MKLLLAFLLSLIATSAFAKIHVFKLYESSVEEYQPFELVLETGRSFSDVKRIIIRETQKGILFFDIPKSGIMVEKKGNEIIIQDTVTNLTCLNKTPYNSAWGDAPLTRKHTYGVYVTLQLKNGSFDSGSLEIGDNEIQEMAMWGELKLK